MRVHKHQGANLLYGNIHILQYDPGTLIDATFVCFKRLTFYTTMGYLFYSANKLHEMKIPFKEIDYPKMSIMRWIFDYRRQLHVGFFETFDVYLE